MTRFLGRLLEAFAIGLGIMVALTEWIDSRRRSRELPCPDCGWIHAPGEGPIPKSVIEAWGHRAS